MILADTKKSQAQTIIGLESVTGVSVSPFKDGLFGLHLSEVSDWLGAGHQAGEGRGHHRAGEGWR